MLLLNIKCWNRVLKFVGLRVWVTKTYSGKAINMAADRSDGETFIGLSLRPLIESGAKARTEGRVKRDVVS